MEAPDKFERNKLVESSAIEVEPISGMDNVDGWNDHHIVPYDREQVRENLKCHGYCCPTEKCDDFGCTRCCCCFDCWYDMLKKIVGPKRNRKIPETIQEWFRAGFPFRASLWVLNSCVPRRPELNAQEVKYGRNCKVNKKAFTI